MEDIEEAIIEKNLSKDITWLEIEALREHHHWLPWQPDVSQGQSEDDCEDPDRLVVFDDVKPLIFEVSKTFHLDLVLAFAEFLGFKSKQLNPSMFELFTESLEDDFKEIWQRLGHGSKGDDNEVEKEIAVNFIQQVLPCFSDQEQTMLTLYLIEIQLLKFGISENLSKSDKKDMRKILKSLLKEDKNRNNLDIWCTYITLEREIGKSGEAKSIAETALSMYGGKQIEGALGAVNRLISVYGLYCEIVLNITGNVPKSMLPKMAPVSLASKKSIPKVLLCMLDGKSFNAKEIDSNELSGPAVLKMATVFVKLVDKFVSSCRNRKSAQLATRNICDIVRCYALYTYCTHGLEAVLKIYSDVLGIVKHSMQEEYSADLERCLHSQKLRLVVNHMSVASCPLSILRSHLDTALEKFPHDLVFLSLFVDIEKKCRVTGKLNRFFDKQCRVMDFPGPTLAAIQQQCEFLKELKNEGKRLIQVV